MELINSQTNDGNGLEERFEKSRQNQQQHERFEKLSETIDQRFTVMMEALKNHGAIALSNPLYCY